MHKNVERTSVTKGTGESERNPDGRAPSAAIIVLEFIQDSEGNWVAVLSCGHTQHLRHNPPWQSRAWVLDPAERRRRIGKSFACGWCAKGLVKDTLGS